MASSFFLSPITILGMTALVEENSVAEEKSAEKDKCCQMCEETVLCDGTEKKRNGFRCPGCFAELHFKCTRLSDYKSGLLPTAVLALLGNPFMKVPLDCLFYCADCEPGDGNGKQEVAESEVKGMVDVEARAALKDLTVGHAAVQSKLDCLVQFLMPDGGQKMELNPTSGGTYAGALEKGLPAMSGLSAAVKTACIEAQQQLSEAEKMGRTVVVDGLPEVGSDLRDAQELLAVLGLKSLLPQEVHRLGARKGSKPRKLKIVCSTDYDYEFLLSGQVRTRLRDPNFPVQGVFVNPSTSSADRRLGFLLRQRRNDLNQTVEDEEDYFFVMREEQRLVRKLNGKPDWAWIDDDFEDWIKDFEQKEERNRMGALQNRSNREERRSDVKQNQSSSGWQTAGKRRGKSNGSKVFGQGNGHRGMGWGGI